MYTLSATFCLLYRRSAAKMLFQWNTYDFSSRFWVKKILFSKTFSLFQLHKNMACQPHDLLTLCSLTTFTRVSHKTLFFLRQNLELLSLTMITYFYDCQLLLNMWAEMCLSLKMLQNRGLFLTMIQTWFIPIKWKKKSINKPLTYKNWG